MRFHHMLLFMADKDSSWRIAANEAVHGFLNCPEKRLKTNTPDLGRFLINLLLSDRGWDNEVASAYLNESLVRQVSWFISTHTEHDPPSVGNSLNDEREGTGKYPGIAGTLDASLGGFNIQSQDGSRRSIGPDSLGIRRDSQRTDSNRKGLGLGGLKDKIVSLSGPTAAQSLVSLSFEYDKRRMMSISRDSGSQVGNESVYDDDAPDGCSVISSSNMHEFTSYNLSHNYNQDRNRTLNVSGTDTTHTRATSYAELVQLESDPVCPYRLVTTFEVIMFVYVFFNIYFSFITNLSCV